jgi:hypothetical protein
VDVKARTLRNRRTVHVYREPSGRGYRTSFTAEAAARIGSSALPEAWVEVRELFWK